MQLRVLKNKLLRSKYKCEEEAAQKYKEFIKFNSLPVTKVINIWRMIWAWHVVHMGEIKSFCEVLEN